jgi:predicted ATPase
MPARRSGQRTYRQGSLPVRRVTCNAQGRAGDDWPYSLPAVAQLRAEPLKLAPVTVLVGENGSGKSTILEAIAIAYGLSREGGSINARHSTRDSESGLHEDLVLTRDPGSSRWGFFLRAETMHGLYTYLEQLPPREGYPDPVFHEMSHGESFLAMLEHRFSSPGLYLLDEPESALSFSSCLALVGVLNELVQAGTSQVIVATHSPIVAAIPSARILQFDGDGFHPVAWA